MQKVDLRCIKTDVLCFVVRQTNLPIFKLKDSCVKRRYSDFEWLKSELERDSKVSGAHGCD